MNGSVFLKNEAKVIQNAEKYINRYEYLKSVDCIKHPLEDVVLKRFFIHKYSANIAFIDLFEQYRLIINALKHNSDGEPDILTILTVYMHQEVIELTDILLGLEGVQFDINNPFIEEGNLMQIYGDVFTKSILQFLWYIEKIVESEKFGICNFESEKSRIDAFINRYV